MSHIYTGTSGFAYASWKPKFYPADLPAKQFLTSYSRRLNAVEINYTFRRVPSAGTVANWIGATPAGFAFSLKAPMRITHILRLQNASEPLQVFFRSVLPLQAAGKLGPILFQLPPNMACDLDRLQAFLSLLPESNRYAFEFRHASWFASPVYELLKQHNTALCLAESEDFETPQVLTAEFAYFRFRKPSYTPKQRQAIATDARKLISDGKDVFAFFKHEETPAGALYAEQLLKAMRITP